MYRVIQEEKSKEVLDRWSRPATSKSILRWTGESVFVWWVLGGLFDEYLEETSFTEVIPKGTTDSRESSTRKSPKSLQSLTKDFVLHKFDGKNSNASTWIDLFQRECERLQIDESRYIEALRLFLDGHAAIWFENRWMTCSSASWNEWYESFQITFSSFGWDDINVFVLISFVHRICSKKKS